MQIAVDFAYRVTVEDLDSGERRTYLVPRGTHTFMEDPEGFVRGKPTTPLDGPNPLTSPETDELPPPPDVTEVLESISPMRGKIGIKAGSMGERVSPKDAYGVPEG